MLKRILSAELAEKKKVNNSFTVPVDRVQKSSLETVELQKILSKLGINQLDITDFKEQLREIAVNKEDFINNKGIFSEKDDISLKDQTWQTLINTNVITPEGYFLNFYPHYQKFKSLTRNKLPDQKVESIFNFLSELYAKRSLASQRPAPNDYEFFKQDILVESMADKVLTEITNYIGQKFFNITEEDYKYIQIQKEGRTYAIPYEGRTIIIERKKFGRFLLKNQKEITFTRKQFNQNLKFVSTRRDYKISPENLLKNDPLGLSDLSSRAREALASIVRHDPFIKIRELLLKNSKIIFSDVSLFSEQGDILNQRGEIQSLFVVRNARDLYHKILYTLPDNNKMDLDLMNRLDEYFKLQISLAAEFNEMYVTKLKKHLKAYSVALADNPQLKQDFYVIQDYEYDLYKSFSLNKQIMAMVIAVYLKDFNILKKLIAGLSLFIKTETNGQPGNLSVRSKFFIDQGQNSEEHTLAEIIKLAAALQKISQENSVGDIAFSENLKVLVNELLELLPNLQNESKKENQYNLADYPLPYLWTLLKYARRGEAGDYLHRNVEKLRLLYEQAIEKYIISAEERRKYKRIIKQKDKHFRHETGLFAKIYEARSFFFDPESMGQDKYEKIIAQVYLGLKNFPTFQNLFSKEINKFESDTTLKMENLEAFINETVLASGDLLYILLQEKLQQDSSSEDKADLEQIIFNVKLAKIGLSRDDYKLLSQEDRFIRRKFNWYMLGVLLPNEQKTALEYISKKLYGETNELYIVPEDLEKNYLTRRAVFIKSIIENLFYLGFINAAQKDKATEYVNNNAKRIELDETGQYLPEFIKSITDIAPIEPAALERLKILYQNMYKDQGYAKYDPQLSQYYLAIDFLWRYNGLKPILKNLEDAHIDIFQGLQKNNFLKKSLNGKYILMPRAFESVDGLRKFDDNHWYSFAPQSAFVKRLDFLINRYPQYSFLSEIKEIFLNAENVPAALEKALEHNFLDYIYNDYNSESKPGENYTGPKISSKFRRNYGNDYKAIILDRFKKKIVNKEDEKLSIKKSWFGDPLLGLVYDTPYGWRMREIFNNIIREIQEINTNHKYVHISIFKQENCQTNEEAEAYLNKIYQQFGRLFLLAIFNKQINAQEELIDQILHGGVKLNEDQKRFLSNYIKIGRLLYSIFDIYETLKRDRGGQRSYLQEIFSWETGYYGYDFPFAMVNLMTTEQREENFLAEIFYKYNSILIRRQMNPTSYLPEFVSYNIELPEMTEVYDLKYYELITMMLYYGLMREDL